MALRAQRSGRECAIAARVTCAQLASVAFGYVDAELDDVDHELIIAHLAECAGCRAYCSQIQSTVELLAIHSEPLPARLRERLLQSYRHSQRGC